MLQVGEQERLRVEEQEELWVEENDSWWRERVGSCEEQVLDAAPLQLMEEEEGQQPLQEALHEVCHPEKERMHTIFYKCQMFSIFTDQYKHF